MRARPWTEIAVSENHLFVWDRCERHRRIAAILSVGLVVLMVSDVPDNFSQKKKSRSFKYIVTVVNTQQ